MSVQFQDNRIQVKGAMNEAALQWLEESATVIHADAQRNTHTKSGQLKGSWAYKVDAGAMEATVGNPSEYAIWQEMGTGEYALNGDGRKGYWVYVEGNGSSRSRHSKQYTLEEAKRVVALLRSKGLAAVYTKGTKPVRMLHKAFESNKKKIISRADAIFKGRVGS